MTTKSKRPARASALGRVPHRLLTLRCHRGQRVAEIRCTEESLNNYWGYHMGDARREQRRFPKTLWEVSSENFE